MRSFWKYLIPALVLAVLLGWYGLSAGQTTSVGQTSYLSLISAVLGGGETVNQFAATLSADASTTVAGFPGASKKNVVVFMDLSAHEDVTVYFYNDATTIDHGIQCNTAGGHVWPGFMPGCLRSADGTTLNIKSVGGEASVLIQSVAR